MDNNSRNRRRGNNRRRQLSNTQSMSTQVHRDLRNVEMLLRNQNTKSLPGIVDVIERPIARDKVYSFKRTFTIPNVSFNTATATTGALDFALSYVPNSTDFTALFDAYRLPQIKVVFTPNAAGNAVGLPFYTVLDYDDNNAPVSINDVLQYDTLQIGNTNSLIERVFTPHAAQAQYAGGAFTSYGRTPASTWLDVASPSIQHYGLKYFMPVSSFGNGSPAFTVTATVYIECMNPR